MSETTSPSLERKGNSKTKPNNTQFELTNFVIRLRPGFLPIGFPIFSIPPSGYYRDQSAE